MAAILVWLHLCTEVVHQGGNSWNCVRRFVSFVRTNKTYDFVRRLLKCYSWNILTIFVAVRTNFRKCSNLRTVSVTNSEVLKVKSELANQLLAFQFIWGTWWSTAATKAVLLFSPVLDIVEQDFVSMIPNPFIYAALSFEISCEQRVLTKGESYASICIKISNIFQI